MKQNKQITDETLESKATEADRMLMLMTLQKRIPDLLLNWQGTLSNLQEA